MSHACHHCCNDTESQLFSWYYSTVKARPGTFCYFRSYNGIALDGCQWKLSSPGLSPTPCLPPFRSLGLWLILVPKRQWLALDKPACAHSFLSSLLASHFEIPSAYKTSLPLCFFSLFLAQNLGFWKKVKYIFSGTWIGCQECESHPPWEGFSAVKIFLLHGDFL